MLTRRCAACHMTGSEPGNIVLAGRKTWASLVNAPSIQSKYLRVKPGLPGESYLTASFQEHI